MKHLKFFGKLVVSGLVALIILCCLASVYSLSPMRVENEFKNTDYSWESESVWMKMTEGISWGITDEKGFNNSEFVENPDILLLGSSHIEGMNVQQEEQAVSLLNNYLGGKLTCYNMGISGHTVFKVVQYLEQSVSAFENPPKYIIIETSTTVLSEEDVSEALNGEVEITTVNNEGIVAKLQRLPFLRQVYHQLESGMLDMLLPSKINDFTATSFAVYSSTDSKLVIDEQPYQTFFEYLEKVESEYGTQIIIMYHPFEIIEESGDISFSNEEYTSVFEKYAANNKIDFVNMTNDFEEMYYEEHYVAHGFSTGALGEGHINKYGHRAIAQRLYEYITDLEEGV